MGSDRISSRQWNIPACILLVCLGVILYGHTLHAPFYLDDIINLVDKPITQRDLHSAIMNILNPRGIANLTFALNYHFGELNLVGYHLVNIAIHILASMVVFGIFSLFVPGAPAMALAGALIFLTHPLQTQSVTYIIQRHTSLSGLFLLCATLLFCHAYRRLMRDRSISAVFFALYITALLCGAAAVITKQSAAILPLLLALAGYFFIEEQGRLRRLMALIVPFFIIPLYQVYLQIALPLAIKGSSASSAVNSISSLSSAADNAVATATPFTYLATEFGVIWLYIRLLFLPYHQALIYDYPMATRLITLTSVAALTGIIALLVTAFMLRKKNRMIACGILWFFVGLTVESTFIPLDPVFEHRLYIPVFGFALVVMGLIRMIPARRAAFAACALLVGIYGILTWQRNTLWSDQIAFYEDNLKGAPGKSWIYVDLGKLYVEKKRFDRAEMLLKRAVELNPVYYKTYNNLGTLYDLTARTDQALAAYQHAISLYPLDAEVHTNIGALYAGQKEWQKAIAQHTIAISLKPGYALAYYNLGVARYSMGDKKGALEAFRKALEITPNDADTIYNLAVVLAETGDFTSAIQLVTRLTAINPDRGGILAKEIQQSKTEKTD